MRGSGVNTYKWVNSTGEAVLVKYHWIPKQKERNLTQEEADAIQATNFNHATQDLYDAIERGEFPEWELNVQIISDDEHPELDFDPLDATKIWPQEQFPYRPVSKMVLNKNPENYFAEVEQAAFGTGVLVDGLDFSDDKLLQGRTFSYSDTQRHRVGPNYKQAGERYRTFEPWERDDLVSNLVSLLSQCNKDIQERMVWHFSQADADYRKRVGQGLGIDAAAVAPVAVGANA